LETLRSNLAITNLTTNTCLWILIYETEFFRSFIQI